MCMQQRRRIGSGPSSSPGGWFAGASEWHFRACSQGSNSSCGRIVALLGAFVVLALSVASTAPARAGQVVMDAGTGAVLAGAAETAPRFPASITKLMTIYVALEAVTAGEIAWDSELTVSDYAAAAPTVKLGLTAGETIPLSTAIHAALTLSANDAARVIAEAVADTEAEFARRMTDAAQALGMTGTVFRNASGLPDRGHLSTAADIARMIVAVDARYGDRLRPLFRAPLVWKGRSYAPRNTVVAAPAGAVFGKTGFTCDAGFTAAMLVERDGRRLALVTLANRSSSGRRTTLASLGRGEAAEVSPELNLPPVVIPQDQCGGALGGWAISLGDFRNRAQATAALSRARKAGAGLPGRILRRAGRQGFHVLLFAPNKRTAVEWAQKLARKRIRARVMAPQKVARAGFEPG